MIVYTNTYDKMMLKTVPTNKHGNDKLEEDKSSQACLKADMMHDRVITFTVTENHHGLIMHLPNGKIIQLGIP